MKKMSRKVLSTILIAAFSLMICAPAFAEDNILASSPVDFFEDNLIETVNLEGTDYTYEYYYNEANHKSIKITDESTGEIENLELITNAQGSVDVYENGEIVGHIGKPVLCVDNENSIATPTSAWTSMGYSCTPISWQENTSVSVIASLISICCVGSNPAIIIAGIGTGALGILAGTSFSCTVCVNSYYMDLITAIQYMHVVGLNASSGIYYGPYTIYTNPIPYA